MEAKYNIDMSRLVELLPFSMRSGSLIALLRVALSPYTARLAALFRSARTNDRFRLNHNGQVCHLRRALNAQFRSRTSNYFDIVDVLNARDILFASTEKLPDDHTFASTEPVSDDGVHAITELLDESLGDFIIYVPSDLYNTQLTAIKHFVEMYKLPTRKAAYKSK